MNYERHTVSCSDCGNNIYYSDNPAEGDELCDPCVNEIRHSGEY